MKSMFNNSKIIACEKVKLYCEVPFARKDEAKIKGAKWDMDKKLWYFQYDLKLFYDNKNLHTYDFEPLFPTIINFNSDDENRKIRNVINNVFDEVQSRWYKFVPSETVEE
jgi:hypothetical protein